MKKIFFLLAIIIVAITAQSFYQTNPQNESIKNGKSIYATYCITCHMENGMGLESAFPPLVKTGNLNDKNKLVKIILQGMKGPITVKGVAYNVEMAAINISDKETVDVINYIRNSWGNKAPLMKYSEMALAKKDMVK